MMLTSRDVLTPGDRLMLNRSGSSRPVKVLEVLADDMVRVQYIVGRRTDLRGTYHRRDLYTR
jgi:hypothetical protein